MTDQTTNEPFYVMDEEDVVINETRESSLKTMAFFKRGYRVKVNYRGNAILAEHAFCLALGWYELIGCETSVQVSIKLFGNPKKKAAVTKCVIMFQEALGIPPMPGQRKAEGKKSMSKARKGQLKA